MKRGFQRQGSAIQQVGSAEHPGSPEELLEFAMNLGRPVPCEQGAADCYPFGSSADPFFQDLGIRTYKSVPKRMADDGEMTDDGRIG